MTRQLTQLRTLDDDELRDAFNSYALREGVSTTVALTVSFFAGIFIIPATIQGRIEWASGSTWTWFTPILLTIVLTGIIAIVDGVKMRRIGHVQTERGRKFISAVRRGRKYDPFEEITLTK